MVLLPSTRIELPSTLAFESVLAPRLMGTPLEAVAAGPLGVSVMPSIIRAELEIAMGMNDESGALGGEGEGGEKTGKVML